MASRRFLAENKIKIEGANIREVASFSEVDFGAEINRILTNTFEAPTAIQRVAWPVVLSGRDTIGLAETGSGKTLAFGLPAIMHLQKQRRVELGEGPVVLVLAPTRELVRQTYRELEKFEQAAEIQV